MSGRRFDDYRCGPSFQPVYYLEQPKGCISTFFTIIGWMILLTILLGMCSCTAMMFGI